MERLVRASALPEHAHEVARLGGMAAAVDMILQGALDTEVRKLLGITEQEPLPDYPDYMVSEPVGGDNAR
jgi:hypothetical protein